MALLPDGDHTTSHRFLQASILQPCTCTKALLTHLCLSASTHSRHRNCLVSANKELQVAGRLLPISKVSSLNAKAV